MENMKQYSCCGKASGFPKKLNIKLPCLCAQLRLNLCDPMDCIAHQAPLSVEFSRQEYWSGLPFLTPGDFPNTGLKPVSPALAGGGFTSVPGGKH